MLPFEGLKGKGSVIAIAVQVVDGLLRLNSVMHNV